MQVVTMSEARHRLKSILDQVENDMDYAVITRRNGADAVIMSMEMFNSIMETMHLLRSPANAAHLAESIEQYRSGKFVEKEIISV